VLREQLDRGVGEDAQLVTLGIGINDIGHGLSVEQFSDNYDRILTTLKNMTRATIVVTNIPDISSSTQIPLSMQSQYQQVIIQFNRKLEEIAAEHKVVVFDIYAVTHEQLPQHPEYYSADGFHPSDKGYELWAAEMWPTVARAMRFQ
jgi:lysophospholipase L1-like esterase